MLQGVFACEITAHQRVTDYTAIKAFQLLIEMVILFILPTFPICVSCLPWQLFSVLLLLYWPIL